MYENNVPVIDAAISKRLELLGHTMKDTPRLNCSTTSNHTDLPYRHPFLDHVPFHGCAIEQGQSSQSNPPRYVQNRPYCRFQTLSIQSSHISSNRFGGEVLHQIEGQQETDEEVRYHQGAFTVTNPFGMPPEPLVRSNFHFVQNVLEALVVDGTPEATEYSTRGCSQQLPGVTLMLQRYEYANLYHVLMDWWNVWVIATSSLVGAIDQLQLIWLDAHPASPLDSVWETLFGDIYRIQRLPFGLTRRPPSITGTIHSTIVPDHRPSGTITCLDTAILVPSGYTSELYQASTAASLDDTCVDAPQMEAFSDWILLRHNLNGVRKKTGNIVMIDRQPYRAHPRANLRADDRVLDNLVSIGEQIQEDLQASSSALNFTVQIVQLHRLSFREQLRVVREAEVLVGNHGAGLSHCVFMDDDTYVLEFRRSQAGLLFARLADWKPKVRHQFLPPARHRISQNYLYEHLLPALRQIYGIAASL